VILVPDSTGLLFPDCFIETPMPSLKCVLSINIGICKGLLNVVESACWFKIFRIEGLWTSMYSYGDVV